jgi:hypothetical protein
MVLVATSCEGYITSGGKDDSENKVKIDNAGIIVVNEKGERVYHPQPSGTYKARDMFGIEYKATFNPISPGMGILKTYDKISGELEYKYKIEIEKETGIEILYVQSKKTGMSMKPQYIYNGEYDWVKLDGILYTK